MTIRFSFWLGVLALATLAGCASRPINEPINQVDRKVGYRLETRAAYHNEGDTLITGAKTPALLLESKERLDPAPESTSAAVPK